MTESFSWSDLFNKAKAVSFEPVPVQDYHISIHEATAVSSSTGKPMLKLKLNIEEGPHQNRKLLDQWVLTFDNETALSIFFRKAKAFGCDENFFATLPPGQLAPLAQVLVGKHAIASVGMREWQGENRNEIKGYKAFTGAVTAPGGMPGMMPQMGMPGMGGMTQMPGMGMPLTATTAQTPTQAPAPQGPVVSTPVVSQTPQTQPQATQTVPTPAPATPSATPQVIQADLPF